MSKAHFVPLSVFVNSILVGAVLIGVMLPFEVFANDSGPERPVNATKLPFLREASSGENVTMDYGNNANTPGQSGNSTDSKVSDDCLNSQNNNCAFRDISGHKSEKSINHLYNKKVVGGRRPCYYDPHAAATRAEVTAMVVRANELSLPKSSEKKAFPDTDLTAWSPRHIKAAKDADIVHGYPDGLFRAEKSVNLVEALKIVTRGFGVSNVTPDTSKLRQISDIDLSQWYIPYVQAAINQGLIESSASYIAPASEVTRSEIADMIYTLMKKKEIIGEKT